MESETHHSVPGEVVDPRDLQILKASEVAALLGTGRFPFVRLVECRRDGTSEIVVVEVEPEVPPTPIHDIRELEVVAISFDPEDLRQPDPRALRTSFPYPPHINLHLSGEARSLCLFEESYYEQKPRWTAARFLTRLQIWLSKTARGELHPPDQALEPIFFTTGNVLVVPAAVYAADASAIPERLAVFAGSSGAREHAIVATSPDKAPANLPPLALAGMAYTATPRTHGVIQHRPKTLAELHRFLCDDGEDLAGFVRQRLRSWHEEQIVPLAHKLLLMVRIPIMREPGGPIEAVEVWGFVTQADMQKVGTAVGIWTPHDGHLAPNIPVDETMNGDEILLDLFNVVGGLTRGYAATLNGEDSPADTNILGIGAGALGSQVIGNLYRSAFGRWTVVDEDLFYPHNAARHLLPVGVGYPKADLVGSFLSPLVEDGQISTIVANVFDRPSDELTEAYGSAAAILDVSASVAVARHLALDVSSDARRLSAFLTPDGRDLVVLAESVDRTTTLDHVEMEYYRALVSDEGLAHHLDRPGNAVRYGNGCRDTSGRIPQELVALHAAIAARAVRDALLNPNASAQVWRANEDRSVSTISVEVSSYSESSAGGWTVLIANRFDGIIAEQRTAQLPNETGGALIGAFDAQRRRIYLVDHVPAPVDSVEKPTAFIRGAEGLPEAFDHVATATAGQLDYAGEWHSHPDGHSTLPSRDDVALFSWLSEHRLIDGFPPLMVISGEGGALSVYLGSIPSPSA